MDAFLDRCAAALGARRIHVPELSSRRPDPAGPPVTADDVREARFPVVLRGYDLAECDRLLREVASMLPERPRRGWDADAVPPLPGPGPGVRTSLRGYARDEVDDVLVRCAHSLGPRVKEVPALAVLTGRPRTGEPLTAAEIDQVQFRLVWRGYAPDAVDVLLDRVRALLPD